MKLFFFMFIFILAFSREGLSETLQNPPVLDSFRQRNDESLFKPPYLEGVWARLDAGSSLFWHSQKLAGLGLEWHPGRWGLHLGFSQVQAEWKSLRTEVSPTESSNDPLKTQNPDAEALIERKGEDLFDFNLIRGGITFLSYFPGNKSNSSLMRTEVGYGGGTGLDVSHSRKFIIRSLYLDWAFLKSISSNKKHWISMGFSYLGGYFYGPKKEYLSEMETVLTIQMAQIQIGYVLQLF